jgi:hypothetical protein
MATGELRVTENNILNPFNCDRSVELPSSREDVPLWTEYNYHFAYDPVVGAGISIHIGREPYDPDIVRATIGVFQPNGELLVAKYSGRDDHSRGLGAGPLRITCVQPMRLWMIEFDGVCQSVSRAELMGSTHRDSPGEPIRFNILSFGVGPLWEHQRLAQDVTKPFFSGHWEQISRIEGTLTRNGKTAKLVGAGMRDHSCGPRDYGPLIGSFWANALFPGGKVVMAQRTLLEHATEEWKQGYVLWGDGTPIEIVKILGTPAICTSNTLPKTVARDPVDEEGWKNFSFSIRTSRGDHTIEGELLHGMPTTYIAPNDELLGTDFMMVSKQPTVTQLCECAARYKWGDEVGYGLGERIARISALK